MEQWEIMRLREINLSLSSLDVLEPDLVLKIDAAYRCRWDLHFSKHSVNYLCPFNQWQVSAFLKCSWGDKITYLMLLELWARVLLLREAMNGGTKCSLYQLNDCIYWLSDDLCNWCVIHNRLWCLRIRNFAESEEEDISKYWLSCLMVTPVAFKLCALIIRLN